MTVGLEPGCCVGPWAIEATLGAGASGTVYRARKGARGTVRALKVLELTGIGSELDRQRFARELELLRRLRHPRLAGLVDHVDDGTHLALVSELAGGEPLSALIGRSSGGLSTTLTYSVTHDIAEALSHLHDHGVVHRDLKPANVIVDRPGRARLVDFGLARLTAQQTIVTQAGQVKGSLHYAAPEILLRQEVGPAADLYALGSVIHEMLTGSPPFVAKAAGLIAVMHLSIEAPRPSTRRPGLAVWWDRIVAKLLEKQPGRRYAGAPPLLSDLDALKSDLIGISSL